MEKNGFEFQVSGFELRTKGKIKKERFFAYGSE